MNIKKILNKIFTHKSPLGMTNRSPMFKAVLFVVGMLIFAAIHKLDDPERESRRASRMYKEAVIQRDKTRAEAKLKEQLKEKEGEV